MKGKKFLAGLIFALGSCTAFHGGETGDPSGGVWRVMTGEPAKYTSYSLKEATPLFPGAQNSPHLEFTVDALDIQDKTGSDLLRRTLYGGLSCEKYAEKTFNKVKDNYLKANTGGWSYIESFDGTVYGSILVISRSRYVYSGGAHGQNEKIFFVLDTDTLSRLSLGDMLQTGAEAALQKHIDGALRAIYGEDSGRPLTEIGFFSNTPEVTGNFFVAREGLGFCWNPYEIAPYSMGTIEVILPYAEIENLLNDRGLGIFKNLK
jgi:hypothetical protein